MEKAVKGVPVRVEIPPIWKAKIAQLQIKKFAAEQAIGTIMETLIEEAQETGGLPKGSQWALSPDGSAICGVVPEEA